MAGRREIGVDIEFDADTGGVDEAATAARALDRELEQLERTERRQAQAAARAERATEQLAAAQRKAAEDAEKLARGEITVEQAADSAARALELEERQARATAAANRVAARAVEEHAESQRQLARDSAAAAAVSGATGDDDTDIDRRGNAVTRLAGRLKDMGKAGIAAFRGVGEASTDAGSAMAKSGGPYVTIGLIAAALTVLPAVAALAGAAITLGVGGALAGLGLKASMASATAQKAIGGLKDAAKKAAEQVGRPWEQVWQTIGTSGEKLIARATKPLTEIGTKIAPAVSKFVEQLGASFSKLGPFVRSAADAFRGLLGQIGSRLPAMMGSLGGALKQLTDEVKQNPAAMASLISGLVTLVSWTIRAVAVLADLYSKLVTVGGAIKDAGKWLGGAGLIMKAFGDDSTETAGAMKGVAVAGGSAATATGSMKTSMQGAVTASDALYLSLQEVAGELLSSRDAARGYQAALDEASASIKTNGATLDINTAKGRANQAALDGIVTAAYKQKESMEAAGAGATEMATHMEGARKKFIQTAISAGMNATAARKLADEMFGVKKRADALPKTKNIKVTADTAGANSKLSGTLGLVQRLGTAIRNTLGMKTSGAVKKKAVVGHKDGGLIKGYASGGLVQGFTGGGLVRGPGGPRTDSVPLMGSDGEYMVNAAATKQNLPLLEAINSGRRIAAGGGMAAGGGSLGGGTMAITLMIGDRKLGDLMIDPLRKVVRVLGGDVQVALGTG